MASGSKPVAIAIGLALVGAVAAFRLITSASNHNHQLALRTPPLALVPPLIEDPKTPRLARRVIFVMIDGLRADHSALPYLDELRRGGVDAVATAAYPTWSRPSYIVMLTGVLPEASGVRTNRVPWAVPFDSIMERAQAAKLRVATAADVGGLPSLFLRPADGRSVRGLDLGQDGDRLLPPADGRTWPFDDVRRAEVRPEGTIEALAPSIASVIAGDAALVLIMVGDVDRAGHRHGAASEQYRAAAATIDRALAKLLAGVDLTRDTIIVTADHGHVDGGGHGGTEPEVTRVPLILPAAGIVPGARANEPRLVDIGPTLAALLALPAPGHGGGRALVEVLQLDREAAARRIAADTARDTAVARAIAGVSDGPDPLAFLIVAAGIALAGALAWKLRRYVVVPRAFAIGALATVVAVGGLLVISGGDLSPSTMPPLERLQKLFAICALAAVGVQLAATAWVLRGRADRLVVANGIALAGLVLALVPPYAVHAWFAEPYLEVPGPFWLLAIPASKLVGACSAAAIALSLVLELVVHARRRPLAP